MKKGLFLMLVVILFSVSVSGQIHLFLEEQEFVYGDGKVTGWVFPATGSQEEVLDDMKDYLKDRSDIKLKKAGNNTLVAEKVSLPAITTKRGDLIGYSRITEQNYSMAIVFKLGYDISLSTTEWEKEMQNLKHYVKSFMTYHYEQVYARRVNDLEKELKGVQKEMDQTESKINSLTKKVNNNSKKIAKETETVKIDELEAEINTLEGDMKVLMDTLPGLQAKIDQLKKQIDQNKAESNTYLSTIATF